MLANIYDEEEYNSFSELYEKWLDEFENEIGNICDNISDDFKSLTVNIATPKLNSKLLKLEIEVDNQTVFVLDCGEKGLKKTDTITIEALNAKISYKVISNDKKLLKQR